MALEYPTYLMSLHTNRHGVKTKGLILLNGEGGVVFKERENSKTFSLYLSFVGVFLSYICNVTITMFVSNPLSLFSLYLTQLPLRHHHHHVQEGLGFIPVPCILKMKLVPPSLPRSSYVSSSFWYIL
jgi:hypothetical protein